MNVDREALERFTTGLIGLHLGASGRKLIQTALEFIDLQKERQRRTMGKIGQFCPKIVELLTGTNDRVSNYTTFNFHQVPLSAVVSVKSFTILGQNCPILSIVRRLEREEQEALAYDVFEVEDHELRDSPVLRGVAQQEGDQS